MLKKSEFWDLIEEYLVGYMTEDHLLEWMDTPLPAFDNKTPMQMWRHDPWRVYEYVQCVYKK